MAKTKQPTKKVVRRKTKKDGTTEDLIPVSNEVLAEDADEVSDEEIDKLLQEQKQQDPTLKLIDVFSGDENLKVVTPTEILEASKSAAVTEKSTSEFLPEDLVGVDLRKKVKDIRREADTSHFQLARTLYYIWVNKKYEEWGFKSFFDYLEIEEQVNRRRGTYLRDTYEWLVTKVKDEAKIKEIELLGWSKAKEIARIAESPDSINLWLERAQNLNLAKLTSDVTAEVKRLAPPSPRKDGKDELNDIIEKKTEADGPPRNTSEDSVTSFSVKLFPEQYAIIKRMMNLVAKETGSASDGNNLTLVAEEFLMNVDHDKGSTIKHIKTIEKRLGAKLIALPETSKGSEVKIAECLKEVEAFFGIGLVGIRTTDQGQEAFYGKDYLE